MVNFYEGTIPRCALISCVQQGVAKIFRKCTEINYFIHLSCSLEKRLLI